MQKSQVATRSPRDFGIAIAKVQSTQAKAPNLIAKKSDNKQEARREIFGSGILEKLPWCLLKKNGSFLVEKLSYSGF